MLKLAADENFNGKIVRGLLRQEPTLDIVRIQDTEVSQAEDDIVLVWAAQAGRILLTHDVNTMPAYAYERVKNGQSMPGIFLVNPDASFRQVIEDILLLCFASLEDEWNDQVLYLPLS
jgi:predicted nuclease of predicted toxin-antitoxin system